MKSGMPHAVTPRILFIDAYDSFSNNIISLIELNLNVSVTVIKIDEPIEDFATFLRSFQGVIAGPGPGHPKNPTDVGLFRELWKLHDDNVLPVLGICLGFQSLVLAFGGKVEPLPQPRHGMLRRIHSEDRSFFRGISNIETIQYHSLHALLENRRGESLDDDDETDGLLKLTDVCSELRPLAWDLQEENPEVYRASASRQARNPASILMAVEHKRKPFYGIQFHPESICSNRNAQNILLAWWNLAQKWNKAKENIPPVASGRADHKLKLFMENKPLASQIGSNVLNYSKGSNVDGRLLDIPGSPCGRLQNSIFLSVLSTSLKHVNLDIPFIFEALKLKTRAVILLDSALHQRPEIGTHSIIGIVTPSSTQLEYNCGIPQVRLVQDGKTEIISLQSYGGSVFSYLKMFMDSHKATGGSSEIPFWGGLMGYINYEACLETISINNHTDSNHYNLQHPQTPDMSFVFVERSIVIDHKQRKIHIQSIKLGDEDWVQETASILSNKNAFSSKPIASSTIPARVTIPAKSLYKAKIRACQDSIHAGDAYELCLTTQSTIKTSKNHPSWPLYLQLRNLNPAPFSAYLRLGSLTLLSSSPERFLAWSRPTYRSSQSIYCGDKSHKNPRNYLISKCQFRPIKGTVKRIPTDPNIPPITLAQAKILLSTPKERAENLMIADLIRHDLHGVVGSGNVHVRKLMVVEEYATLYQLVTVIEGTLYHDTKKDNNNDNHHPQPPNENQDQPNSTTTQPPTSNTPTNPPTGIDVLAASLPPGSMTGAPKRRACTILQDLEAHPRGIYSGVLGYLDAGGGGDFSVVIRSAFRWSEDLDDGCGDPPGGDDDGDGGPQPEQAEEGEEEGEGDIWTVGAGGAITSLSTEEAEWEEMMAKMKSTVGVFERG